MECPTPSSKPACPLYPTFGLIAEHEIPITISKDDFAWLLASTFNTTEYSSDGTSDKSDDNQRAQVPVWSGYNSLVNKVLPVTRVGAPPLLIIFINFSKYGFSVINYKNIV